MPALTVPSVVAALLLVLAGAAEGGRSHDDRGRPSCTAAARVTVGGADRFSGGAGARRSRPSRWAAPDCGGRVAASYLAFGAFVFLALRRGTMIGSCGCFGREETPPHAIHVVLDLLLVSVAALTAIVSPAAPLDAITEQPGAGVVVLALSALALFLLHAAFVELPRTLVPSARWAGTTAR